MERPSAQHTSKKQSDKSPADPVDVTEGLQRDAFSVTSKRSKILQLLSNILFIIPPILFLTYAVLAAVNDGKRSDIYPVPQLQSAAKYGPTVFPVAFAAVVGAFLANTASWRLERGISMLSLEHLLYSRTLFSAVMAPVSLRSTDTLAVFLLALWIISPLGGQAALRVIEIVPGTHSEPWQYQYLDVLSPNRACSPTSSGARDLMPSIVGAFNVALASPGSIKNASMDAFGNLKIPMLESCSHKGVKPDKDGWIDTNLTSDCVSTSINGVPIHGHADTKANHTFNLETSYTYSDCSINYTMADPDSWWKLYYSLLNETSVNNGLTMGMSLLTTNTSYPWKPQQLLFESITWHAKTQATCSLSQTYIETEVFCHHTDCKATRIRNSTQPHNATYYLPVHGKWADRSIARPCPQPVPNFLQGLVNASMFMAMYGSDVTTDPYSTPLESYMVNPDLPYSSVPHLTNDGKNWRGADIYPVGDRLFSQRFSQLWNTWWQCIIAPEAAMGVFDRKYHAAFYNWDTNMYDTDYWDYNIALTTGTMTPDVMQLHSHNKWLTILIFASVVMLAASVANVVVVLLQTRQGFLELVSVLVKDNPNAVAIYRDGAKKQDGRMRMRDVRLSVRDRQVRRSGYEMM